MHVTYVILDYNGKYQVKNLSLDASGRGEIIVPKLGLVNASVTMIPSIEDIGSGVDDKTPYTYSIVASTQAANSSAPTNVSSGNSQDSGINLPFTIDKPLNQMSKEELMNVLLKLIIYLLSQGKTIF